jgi:Gpi18-like mannosyltransferase
MELSRHENKLVLALLLITTSVFIYISIISKGVYAGADNFIHYRLSRYSFSYPQFFLDHWGKPLFTLLSSPFSQFGFNGLKIFNVLTGCSTGFLAYKISRQLGYKNAVLAMIFTFFMPMFFIMMFTGMTEILFSFVTILSVYLFLKEHYIAAAIAISFLPFARTEGIAVIPCFFLALLYLKKYKAILFLGFGVLAYSLVGGFYYHDFFWVVTKMPS